MKDGKGLYVQFQWGLLQPCIKRVQGEQTRSEEGSRVKYGDHGIKSNGNRAKRCRGGVRERGNRGGTLQ